MILNKNYDMSLWLILHSDKVNRGVIAEFINNIPKELRNEIQSSLKCYMDTIVKNGIDSNIDRELLSGEFVTTGDMKYWYMVNLQTGALQLGEAIVDGREQYDTVQITLLPVNDVDIKNMKNYTDSLIGEMVYSYEIDDNSDKTISDFDLMQYYILKLPFGGMIVNSCDSVKNKYSLLNMEIVPCNYSVTDLSDRSRLNKLVRGRRYKKF